MKTWRDWLQDVAEDWEGWAVLAFVLLVSGCAYSALT